MSEINVILKATDEASKTIADAGDRISSSLKEVESAGSRVSETQKRTETSSKDLALGMNNVATASLQPLQCLRPRAGHAGQR